MAAGGGGDGLRLEDTVVLILLDSGELRCRKSTLAMEPRVSSVVGTVLLEEKKGTKLLLKNHLALESGRYFRRVL